MSSHGFSPSRRLVLAGSAALMTASGAAWAQPPEAPATSIKHGVSLVRGHRTPYRVETGETVLRTADGAAGVTMFSVSYIDEHAPPATRPVTFIYNGGPGGATWPLREAVSPKMIVAAKTAPGYAFANNPDSLMDVSDLVFIDAPGTGYSRLLTEAGKTEFLGVEEDGRAFSTCIERWLDAHGRRRSPKFILGESYGGIRTGQIMKVLGARAQPIHFTGVILISPAVDPLEHGRTGLSDAAATLPTQAAVAHLYGRGAYVRKALEQVAAQARVFANGPYQAALDRIGQLTPDERGRLAEQVSAYIGFPKDAVLAANLAVPEHQFRDELLADQGQVLGEDGRVHHAPFKPGESDLIDVAKGYDLQAAIEGLLTDELGYRPFGRYSRDPTEIGRHWNSKVTSEPYKLQDILKAETRARPHFRIFLAGGYYDLIVPYSLPLNSLESVGLPPRRFIHRLYPTGHPVLNDAAARPHATDEIRTFYRAA